jgi:hypothetical protein
MGRKRELINKQVLYRGNEFAISGYATAGDTVYMLWLRGVSEITVAGKKRLSAILKQI